MSRVYRRGPARIEANLTPLVDVVFLLIIFFVLVAQITKAERLRLTLPWVADAQTEPTPRDSRIVINVLPEGHTEDGRTLTGGFRVGVQTFAAGEEGVAALTELLAQMRSRDPNLEALVRADRVESYGRVHPAVRACRDAGIARINLVTEPERGANGGGVAR
ncbi:MAG: biopolymer transporter ExbD [Phycisphaeraceae bacterium]|nr:MAG: biopolymer transporter ExbD [Phycisphaeraceae bacterium]